MVMGDGCIRGLAGTGSGGQTIVGIDAEKRVIKFHLMIANGKFELFSDGIAAGAHLFIVRYGYRQGFACTRTVFVLSGCTIVI